MNSKHTWFEDGAIDGFLVRPWVALVILASVVAACLPAYLFPGNYLDNGPLMESHSIIFIISVISALILTFFLGMVAGAFIGAAPLKWFWNRRNNILYKWIHGKDNVNDIGNISYWGAWWLAFMWQMGIGKDKMRQFNHEYLLARARKLGYR